MRRNLMTVATIILLSPAIAVAQERTVDPLQYPGAAWSPYVVGALIGVLSMFTFYFSNKPLGASTAYARLAGLLGKTMAPRHTRSLTYFQDNPPKVGWEFMLVIGVVLGGFLSALSGGELTGRLLPEMWQARFGPDSGGLRIFVALAGGMLMSFGARMAGGCTSGHGISGTLQLAVGSWVSATCFFIGGIAVAMLMYA